MLAFEDLLIAKAVYDKGTREEIEEFIYELCHVTGGRDWLIYKLFWVQSVILFSPQKELNLAQAVLGSRCFGAAEVSMTLLDFKTCRHLPSVRKFLGSVLMPPDSGRPGYQVPPLQHPDNLNPDLLILRKEYAWHIGGTLSQQEVDEWMLLYRSTTNGLSFNTFMSSISVPSISALIALRMASDLEGDQITLVSFSLRILIVATHLHAQPFNSPCLSMPNQIKPEVIEYWGVQVKGVQDETQEHLKGTILERFKEDHNMLKKV